MSAREHRRRLHEAVDAARRRQVASFEAARRQAEIVRQPGESHRAFGVRQARTMLDRDRRVRARIIEEAGR